MFSGVHVRVPFSLKATEVMSREHTVINNGTDQKKLVQAEQGEFIVKAFIQADILVKTQTGFNLTRSSWGRGNSEKKQNKKLIPVIYFRLLFLLFWHVFSKSVFSPCVIDCLNIAYLSLWG